ncbi:MAG TPA: hypothetical protein PKI01_12365 [Bacteroidales bacterium]|nr:hypothetical protein [Bacteroidales bacterium]
MSHKSLFFLAIISIAAFSSCNQAVKKNQLARIDSLITIIDTTTSHLNAINRDTVARKYKAYQETNKKVAEHYQKYRNEENWGYVCNYQNVRKPFKTMVFNYNSFKADLKSAREQLENLKHDVQEGLISEEEFNNFFTLEAKNTNDVSIKINKQVESVLNQYKNFDTIQPYMLKLIDSYAENKNK